MPPGRHEAAGRASGAGRRPVLAAIGLVAILAVLLVLTYYFAARREPDWVLVAALGLCAAAVAARLAGLVRPGRPK
jgi:peptidoglycan/LPS O-acetylase OafA/YrhL